MAKLQTSFETDPSGGLSLFLSLSLESKLIFFVKISSFHSPDIFFSETVKALQKTKFTQEQKSVLKMLSSDHTLNSAEKVFFLFLSFFFFFLFFSFSLFLFSQIYFQLNVLFLSPLSQLTFK